MTAPLLTALREPAAVAGMTPPALSALLAQARATGLLAHVAWRCGPAGTDRAAPAALRTHFDSALRIAAEHARHVDWELRRLAHTLAPVAGPVLLLKGAAYQALALPHAAARHGNDLDLMVGREELEPAAALLRADGWTMAALTPDQVDYFRAWMHELPIFQHGDRGTLLDLHHNILPAIDRIRIPAAALWSECVPVPGRPRYAVLSPRDMVIHAALNLFRHGDFQDALRNLVDVDVLLRHFGGESAFWPALADRAESFGATQPLFLACRYAALFLHTPLPAGFSARTARWRLRLVPLRVLDAVFVPAIAPPDPAAANRRRQALHGLLRHYPPCLWRKTLRPKLDRLLSPRRASREEPAAAGKVAYSPRGKEGTEPCELEKGVTDVPDDGT